MDLFVFPVITPEVFSHCDSLSLTWTLPVWMEGKITRYVLSRATSVGGPYTELAKLDAGIAGYVDTTATSGTYYYILSYYYSAPAGEPDPEREVKSLPVSGTVVGPENQGPTDIAFVFDNTGSMGQDFLKRFHEQLDTMLNCIVAAAGSDYRLALVTPDLDQVNVRLNFSANNRAAFKSAIAGMIGEDLKGGAYPESTDECLNTVLNGKSAAGRENPRPCSPPSTPLQINNFSPAFRSWARKLVVMITDATPGGFCDKEDDSVPRWATVYGQQARRECVHINSILVENENGYFDAAAGAVLRDQYAKPTCGWYSQVPKEGDNVVPSVLKMIYESGYCSCP